MLNDSNQITYIVHIRDLPINLDMKTSIFTQHQEYMEWLDKLVFYKEELKVMQKRLEEVVAKNTNSEMKFKAEHFQNLIFIEEQSIHKLSHHLLTEDKKIQYNISQNPVASDHRMAEDHVEDRNMIAFFEKNFNEIKKEFYLFVSAWM